MVDIYSERYYKSKCLEYNLVLQKGYNVSFNLISLWIVSSALCARGQNELKDLTGNLDSDKSVQRPKKYEKLIRFTFGFIRDTSISSKFRNVGCATYQW